MSGSVCYVCCKPTTLFNYGIPSCNACKMFFRRAVHSKSTIKCGNGNTCSRPLECRYCRFEQCLRAGMRTELVREYRSAKDFNRLSAVISSLSAMNTSREHNLMSNQFPDDLTLDQLLHGSVRFHPRPSSVTFTFFDWGFAEQITTIDYIKNFDFTKKLTSRDSEVLVYDTYFKWSCFIISWRCFNEKQEVVKFPGGFDIFPPGIAECGVFSPLLLSRLRSRLIGKLCELKMSEEEFLLVGAVIFCNPAIPGLSSSGRRLLTSHQRIFSSALFQQCLITYQSSGPSRFTDLLSLCTVINDLFEDIKHYFFLLQMCVPHTQMRQLYVDLHNFRFD